MCSLEDRSLSSLQSQLAWRLELKTLNGRGGKMPELGNTELLWLYFLFTTSWDVFFSDPGCPTSGRSISVIYLEWTWIHQYLWFHSYITTWFRWSFQSLNYLSSWKNWPSCDVVDNFIFYMFSASWTLNLTEVDYQYHPFVFVSAICSCSWPDNTNLVMFVSHVSAWGFKQF